MTFAALQDATYALSPYTLTGVRGFSNPPLDAGKFLLTVDKDRMSRVLNKEIKQKPKNLKQFWRASRRLTRQPGRLDEITLEVIIFRIMKLRLSQLLANRKQWRTEP